MRPIVLLYIIGAMWLSAVVVMGTPMTLNGLVSSPDGQPIENAAVNAYIVSFRIGDFNYDIHHAGQTTSNAEGRFSLSPTSSAGLGHKTTLLFAEKEGLSIAFAYMMNPDDYIHLELTAPQTLSGRVENACGEPVADALVRLPMLMVPMGEITAEKRQLPMAIGAEPIPYFTALTDADGRFAFKNLPENCTAEIMVKKSGLGPFESTNRHFNPQTGCTYRVGQEVVVMLPDPFTLTGVVTRPDEMPVGGVTVRVQRPDTFYPPSYLPVQTDANGMFTFTDVAPGTLTLSVSDPNWLSEWVTVNVKANMDVPLKVSKGTLLTVTVADNVTEEPIEGAQVHVLVQEQHAMPHIGSTKQDGTFEKRLFPGTYQIHVHASGYRGRQPETIEITDGQPVALTISLDAPVRITGSVIGPDGKPMAGAVLSTVPGYRTERIPPITDETGAFVLGWEPEQHQRTDAEFYILAVHYNENLAVSEKIERDTKEVHLTLRPGLTVSGMVVDPNGKPIADAEARVFFRGSRWSSSMTQLPQHQTDKDGRYTISALPPEQRYNIHITGPAGYGTGSIDLDEDPQETRLITAPQITLKRADLSVSGIVVDKDGNPVPDVRVNMHGSGQPSGHAVSDRDGKFTFDRVCEGPIQINAWHRGADEHLHANVQTDGGAQDITLILAPPRTPTPRSVLRHPVSLLGKPLPDLSAYGLEPVKEPSSTLVCVWDWQQGPSRYLVRLLALQADALAGRSTRVVLLNAEIAEREPLDAWLREYDIPFTCGAIEEDPEAAHSALGIRALPWLILTNAEGTVIGEGVELSALLQKQYAEKVRKPQKAQTDSNAAITAGMSFPNIEFHDLTGNVVSTDNLKGKVVLINFWATWCGPCIAETPALLSVYEDFREQGLEIIGISLDSDRQALTAYIEKNKIQWPNYFDGNRWENKIAARFGIRGIPAIVLLDKDGIVKETNLRGDKIRTAVAGLFGEIESQPAPINPDDWKNEYTIELKGVEDVTAAPFGITWFRPSGIKNISTEKPDFITSLPPFKYAMQRYLTLRLGNAENNRIFGVIDFRKPEQKFFPFDLYLDRNGDGNLADDFAENNERIMGVQIPYNDGTTENYSLHIYSYFDGEAIELACRGLAGRYGIFPVGQKSVQMLILDYNSNGIFNDRKDLILVDWDVDGKFNGDHDANPGAVALYSPLVLPGAIFQVAEIDPPGRRMVLRKAETPVEPPFEAVK